MSELRYSNIPGKKLREMSSFIGAHRKQANSPVFSHHAACKAKHLVKYTSPGLL